MSLFVNIKLPLLEIELFFLNYHFSNVVGNMIHTVNLWWSAQCYPRHACPLYGALLMQLRDPL